MGRVEVSFAPMFEGCEDLHETLYALLSSIQPGDFFALNAFLPFTGEGRREAIEQIRHGVANPSAACRAWRWGRATCIPRVSCRRVARTWASSLFCRLTS